MELKTQKGHDNHEPFDVFDAFNRFLKELLKYYDCVAYFHNDVITYRKRFNGVSKQVNQMFFYTSQKIEEHYQLVAEEIEETIAMIDRVIGFLNVGLIDKRHKEYYVRHFINGEKIETMMLRDNHHSYLTYQLLHFDTRDAVLALLYDQFCAN